MNLERLLSAPPKLHGPDAMPTDGWRLDDAALLFLESRVRTGMRTIETGAGVSTIAFAIKRTRHTCVVPNRRVVRRIGRYCASVGISLRSVTFVLDRSEYALPRLHRAAYDFALIDGRHGFPAPFIDWFYIADRLRRGGVVLVDDTWIWTCDVLVRFLRQPRMATLRRSSDLRSLSQGAEQRAACRVGRSAFRLLAKPSRSFLPFRHVCEGTHR